MSHEFDGRKYEKASTHQRQWGMKIISELSLKGDERVLDLGSGDGTNTEVIAGLVPDGHVIGIDASRGMMKAAKPKERENLQFIVMDINEMDFENEFDVIISNAALHWVKDHSRLLRKVRKALKAGGLIRFNFAGAGNCKHFFTVISKAMRKDQFVPLFKDFSWPWYMPSVDEYEDLVKKSGLEDVRVWGENADYYFPDKEALIGWVEQPSLVPLLSHIRDAYKSDFRKYVINEMIQATLQADGRFFETFRRINVFAKKE